MLNLDEIILHPPTVFAVPPVLAQKRKLLPFTLLDNKVLVATSHKDESIEHVLRKYFNNPIEQIICDEQKLREKIQECYGPLLEQNRQGEDQAGSLALTNEIIHAANLCKASDIHIDPHDTETIIRFRINGQLELYKSLSKKIHSSLVSRYKIISGMDISEKRSPQDGKYLHLLPSGQKVDIRVASIPSKSGEKLTMRIMGHSIGHLNIESLGLEAKHVTKLKSVLRQNYGLVMVSGATGSGKTTSLYTLMKYLINQADYNIITIEDPVEYEVEDIVQVEVENNEKLTFASALRSVLRHDPDVIMVGEIRDVETAQIAIRASMTGHLVLSTVHANSASAIITRLQDMGIEPYLLAATLKISISQTLVKKICPSCKKKVDIASVKLPQSLVKEFNDTPIYEGHGCEKCAGTGTSGRMAIFELLHVDDYWMNEIGHRSTETEMAAKMRARGIPSVREDALAKVKQGLIPWTELNKFI